jgi:hypothetical protein
VLSEIAVSKDKKERQTPVENKDDLTPAENKEGLTPVENKESEGSKNIIDKIKEVFKLKSTEDI